VRDWPAGLVSEIASPSARLAYGLLVERTDGLQLALSSADRASTISGVPIAGAASGSLVYAAEPEGISVSAVARSAGTAVDNLEGRWLEGGAVTLGDVLAGRWAGAAFTLFVHCWADPSLGVGVLTFGEVGKIKPRTGYFEVEFRDVRQRMQANTTWVTQKDCRWELYSTDRIRGGLCGVNPASHTFTAVPITAVASAREFTLGSLSAQVADRFGNGIVTFETGDLEGLEVRVRTHATGGVITLDLPMVYPITTSDTVTIKAGCRKRWDVDCRDKFDNLRRFGGEKDAPGPDKSMNPVPEPSA
jgi:uncharacterized phage protein (TIGR02218 family)